MSDKDKDEFQDIQEEAKKDEQKFEEVELAPVPGDIQKVAPDIDKDK